MRFLRSLALSGALALAFPIAAMADGASGKGGGGSGGSVTLTPPTIGAPWYSALVNGASLVGLTNGLPIQPATGAVFPVSISSLPALPAGANTIGAVNQAGGPWTENQTQLAGTALGAPTAWGSAPSGIVQGVNANVLALPALPAGGNTIGAVTQASGPWTQNQTQINGVAVATGSGASNTGTQRVILSTDSPAGALTFPGTAAPTAIGTTPGSGTVPTVNAQVLNATPPGSNTMANANPVTMATDQPAMAVKAASGMFAAGSLADILAITGPSGTPAAGVVSVQGAASMYPLASNITQVAGNAVATAGTGMQKVGIAGNAGAQIDTAFGNTMPTNGLSVAAKSSGGLTPFIQAAASAPINTSAAATSAVVALSSGKGIYVTAIDFVAAGTTNVSFVYGTGSNCATGTTTVAGPYSLTAQNGVAKGNGLGPLWFVPASNALCIVNSAAVQVGGSVSYSQF